MVWKGTGFSRLCRAAALLLFCCLFFAALPVSAEQPALSVSLPGTVKGFSHCTITVTAPAAGESELRLYDSLDNPWLIRRETLSAGENQLAWDGRGANGELLMSGPYRLDVLLRAEGGAEYTASASFTVQGYNAALALALPSSETLYLDQKEGWFVECWVPSKCIVAMDVTDVAGNLVYTRSVTLENGDRAVIRWNGTGSDYKKLAPGEYTVRLYPKRNPDFDYVWPLTVQETTPAAPEPAVTGPVLPERGMTDEEIWEIMMKPSVVVNRSGASLRFKVREEPSDRSAVVGLICCATQGLEILEIKDNWALIRAGNYSDGSLITGWYPLRDLVTVSPAPHYAVLVDKSAQTLTVWQDGHPIGTVPVSTGLPTEKHPERETSPGAFLTDVHIARDFAQDGLRYDYPLRYQGGNIIHSTGFSREAHTAYSVKDYSKNLPLLGQKASHGCVRVSPFADADNPINSYWLWTHLPYHTRVIIIE